MAGNLNALGLILVIVLTGTILARYGTWPKSPWRVIGGVAAAFGVLFAASFLTAVLYFEANNFHQLLIPSVCLALVLIFTKPNRIRTIAAVAVALSTFVWSFHVLYLVGPSASYTGDPYWAKRSCRVVTRAHLRAIRSIFSEDAEEDNRDYPSGWLSETELGRAIPSDYLTYTKSPSVEIHPFWHSPLTGLYGKTYHELSLWYPGGRLKDGLQHLEYKPR